jgi:hypothetical protein
MLHLSDNDKQTCINKLIDLCRACLEPTVYAELMGLLVGEDMDKKFRILVETLYMLMP